ncbi:MAG: DUF3592 domain-containing protein [Burkholderiaceae bacterium]|nr:DUF3592 domain-containing protein [Burkholderiaceae bacterium]
MGKKPLSKGQCIAGACIFLLIGFACLVGFCLSVNAVLDSYSAADWPAAQRSVISSDAQRGCGKGGRRYFPRIRYQYNVGGTIYTEERIAFGVTSCGSLESAQEITHRYPLNNEISVHYKPGQPSEAVLMVAGVLTDTYIIIAFEAAGSMLFILLGVSSIQKLRRISAGLN